MLAISSHASALAMVASKCLARQWLRPNQANVRSTTQRLRSTLKVPTVWDLVTISMVHFGDCIQQLVTAIDAIREDIPELGKGGAERFQQWHCTVIVLNIDGMDLNCNDVSLAPFQSLCRIKSTRSAILTVDDASRRHRPAFPAPDEPA